MTIDEAIEILSKGLKVNPVPPPNILDDAIKLGIEALKRIKEQREFRFSHMNRLLPGETAMGRTTI